ncbi:MAG: hypothetical protein GY842_26590 [bacterium]|nr:hypothetical protein [bacterium]
MSALERAQEDIEQGHYGLARQRLTSYLVSKGYDAELVAKIAQLSYDMHDVHQAGRYWLVSEAEGEHVDEAIALFVKRSGSVPSLVVNQLPRVLRLPSFQDYPEAVRRRISSLGLEGLICMDARKREGADSGVWGDRLMLVGCLTVTVLLVVVFLIGLGTIIRWLFS